MSKKIDDLTNENDLIKEELEKYEQDTIRCVSKESLSRTIKITPCLQNECEICWLSWPLQL